MMLLGHRNLCHVISRGLARDQAVLQVHSTYTYFLQKCEVTKLTLHWKIYEIEYKNNFTVLFAT